jgi:hypothetical protein
MNNVYSTFSRKVSIIITYRLRKRKRFNSLKRRHKINYKKTCSPIYFNPLKYFSREE